MKQDKRIKFGFNAPPIKTSSGGGGGGTNALQLLIARDMLQKEEESKKAKFAQDQGGVPTKVEADDVTYELPGARTATAQSQNQLTKIKQLRTFTKGMEDLAATLPGNLFGKGGIETAKAELTRGQKSNEVFTYRQARRSLARGLYRAITQDDRISDSDAENAALPLVWDTLEGDDVKEDKYALLNYLMDEAERGVSPNPPENNLESFQRFQGVINRAKEKYKQQKLSQNGLPLGQSQVNFEQERQQAIQAIQSGKDSKKVADIFRSRTGQELNG